MRTYSIGLDRRRLTLRKIGRAGTQGKCNARQSGGRTQKG